MASEGGRRSSRQDDLDTVMIFLAPFAIRIPRRSKFKKQFFFSFSFLFLFLLSDVIYIYIYYFFWMEGYN